MTTKDLFSGKRKFFSFPIVGILGFFFLPITILIFVGWLIYKKVQNKGVKFTSLSVIAVLALFFGAAYISALVNPNPPKSLQEVKGEATQTTQDIHPSQIPTPTAFLEFNDDLVMVELVIDGDTIEVGGGIRVRLIGIDTPETVDPSRPVGCYGKEASNFTKSQLEGKEVKLEKDVSETDRYGRLLRYIWVGDSLFNETLVKEGYAQSSTFPPDVKYQERFVTAQAEARNDKKGLWGAVCQTPTSKTLTQPTSSSTVKPVVKTDTPSGGSCKYSCNGPDRDCGDFSTHTEAQAFFNCCGFSASYDPMRLDKATGQGNGLACESLP